MQARIKGLFSPCGNYIYAACDTRPGIHPIANPKSNSNESNNLIWKLHTAKLVCDLQEMDQTDEWEHKGAPLENGPSNVCLW